MSKESEKSIQVSPPEKFSFQSPINWPQWKKRFERYIAVAGLSKKSDEEKIDILLYIMGEESEQVVIQFPQAPKTFNEMLEAFENYFIPRRNVIFERFKFNSRQQLPGESVDSFITSLHSLAEHCEYGALKEDLIRDRIVVGMSDVKTSERLQLQSNLKLADAILAAKQAEIQQKQNNILRQEANTHVNAIRKKGYNQNDTSKASSAGVQERFNHKEFSCKFCGLKPFHVREHCPAKNAVCRGCDKRGHWDKVCKSKKLVNKRSVKNINSEDIHLPEEEASMGTQFIGSIERRNISHTLGNVFQNEKNQWMVSLKVGNLKTLVSFLVDTGADITCIPLYILNNQLKSSIKSCSEIISGPDGKNLCVIGKLNLNLYYSVNKKSCDVDVYVIKDLKIPILGRPGISGLSILHFNNSINNVSVSMSLTNIEVEFPNLFQEIGEFKDEIEIKLKGEVKPFIQSTPRIVPIPLLDKLDKELKRLVKLNIIVPVENPTSWVAPIVVIPKGDTVRICCDYTQLNKNVLRSHFPIPKVETTLTKLKDSCIFSKLDVKSSFYQLKLSKTSQPLTTFITPFGRFMFKRLPFGIVCAPEYFSQKFSNIFKDLKGVITHVDDVLVYASDAETHDKTLREVLARLNKEGITLNKNKCVIGVDKVSFLGHVISKSGVKIDPSRIEAICQFPEPTNKKEVQRLLGMINFVARFIPNKSEILEPLNCLLKNDFMFVWDKPQQESFQKIQELLSKAPCLAFFDPSKQIIVSADASCYGLGSALMQLDPVTNERELVAYASRTLTPTECRYAQIEKEALGLTWACEKFQEYLIGISIILETDHRPLLQILQTKYLDELSPRLQRFRMRLMRYDYTVMYTPGHKLHVADTLSRSPLQTKSECEELHLEVESFVRLIVKNLPIKDNFLKKIIHEQQNDSVCKKLHEFVVSGWPEKNKLTPELALYYQFRNYITFSENLLLKGNRIIIPPSLQQQVLQFIHTGHQGIVKCRERAKMSVWWIGLSSQIEQLVKFCPNCIEERTNIKETFLKDEVPSRPWSKVAVDLFKHKVWYLIITDYYSRFFEIVELKSLSELNVVMELKKIFSRFGIPDILRSDNGPQFQSLFKKFAHEYNFTHVTSSPYFSQSNGCVEAAVKTAKSLLKKNEDINLALMAYRSTPLECGFSPYELLFSRKMKTLLPLLPSRLEEVINTNVTFQQDEERRKEKQKSNYNNRHKTKELGELSEGSSVWVTDIKKYGRVKCKAKEPRSYIIETEDGVYRRNRWYLIEAPYYKSNVIGMPRPMPELSPDFISGNDTGTLIEKTDTTENNLQLGSRDNDFLDKSATSKDDSVCEPKGTQSQNCEIVPESHPRRISKKPSWLKDFVTK